MRTRSGLGSARRARLPFVLALALAVGSSLTGCGPSSGVGRPSVGGSASSAAWTALPRAPLPDLRDVTGAWTGTEFIVAGDGQDGVGHAAAYDPFARRWRTLAAPPSPRSGGQGYPQSVWTGTELVVWGGGHREVYNLAEDRWREIPREDRNAPGPAGFALVWTGSRVVGFGGGCCAGVESSGGILDPTTGRWSPLPKGPLTARTTSAVWTGQEVVFIAGEGLAPGSPAAAEQSVVPLRDVSAYNPTTGRWRSLPELPFPGEVRAFWGGTRIVVVGELGAAAWSPGSDRWSVLPAGLQRREDGSAVLAGDRLVVLGGRVLGSAAAGGPIPAGGQMLSLSGGTWTALPKTREIPRTAAMAWTGRQLLVYGGGEPDGLTLTL